MAVYKEDDEYMLVHYYNNNSIKNYTLKGNLINKNNRL